MTFRSFLCLFLAGVVGHCLGAIGFDRWESYVGFVAYIVYILMALRSSYEAGNSDGYRCGTEDGRKIGAVEGFRLRDAGESQILKIRTTDPTLFDDLWDHG